MALMAAELVCSADTFGLGSIYPVNRKPHQYINKI